MTSKNCRDYYCLNCFHSVRTKNKLESHKTVYENKDFCKAVMPFEEVKCLFWTKLLLFKQYRKSDKAKFIIYGDLESLIVKIDGCKSNPGKSSMTKISEHIPYHIFQHIVIT